MVTFIAEAGLNHNGSVDAALKMVDAAKRAEADIVKFQTYVPEKLMRANDPDYDLLSSLALQRHEFIAVAKHCEASGIEFMTTPGDYDSLKFAVEELGVKRIKLGSDDLTNRPLQNAVRATGLPKIQSTGMGDLLEVLAAVETLGHEKLTLLHTVSCYPTHLHQANLKAITTMKDFLTLWEYGGVPIGYSDHTARTWVIQGAVILGAEMIEAHFMLMDGAPPVDAAVSFTPLHLTTLVKAVRQAEVARGDGTKAPNTQEKVLMKKVRKAADGFRGVA